MWPLILLSVSVGINLFFFIALGRAEQHYNRIVKIYVEQGRLIAQLIVPSKEKDSLKKAIEEYEAALKIKG